MVSRCRAVAFVTGNLPRSKATEVGDAVLNMLGRLGVRPIFPSQVCHGRALGLLTSYIGDQQQPREKGVEHETCERCKADVDA